MRRRRSSCRSSRTRSGSRATSPPRRSASRSPGMALGAYAEAVITPARRAAGRALDAVHARDLGLARQRGRAHRAHHGVGGLRRDGAEDRRAASSHRDRAPHDAADALVGPALRVVHRRPRSQLERAALAAAGAAGDAPSRALARGDRAAHRREPRRRAARAAGTGAAAPRAAPRAAQRRPVDGAARSPGRDRDQDARSATSCASSRPARTAGSRSTAARSTTSPASCTPRTSSPTSCSAAAPERSPA